MVKLQEREAHDWMSNQSWEWREEEYAWMQKQMIQGAQRILEVPRYCIGLMFGMSNSVSFLHSIWLPCMFLTNNIWKTEILSMRALANVIETCLDCQSLPLARDKSG